MYHILGAASDRKIFELASIQARREALHGLEKYVYER
jgi:hypothetical protein